MQIQIFQTGIDRYGLGWIRRLLCCSVAILVLVLVHPAHAVDKFKPFKLKTIDGVTRTLKDYQGKAILVTFFFPTCTYCNKVLPETLKIYNKYKDQGLKMVWINIVREEDNKVPAWLAQHRYNMPVLVGASQRKLLKDYKIEISPEQLLVGRDGDILYRQRGYQAGDAAVLEGQIKQALHRTGQSLVAN